MLTRNNYSYLNQNTYSPASDFENTENLDPMFTQQKTFSPIQNNLSSPIHTGKRVTYERAVDQYVLHTSNLNTLKTNDEHPTPLV